MKRRLVQFLFALSVMFTAISAALWARGFWGTDQFVAERGTAVYADVITVTFDQRRVACSVARFRPSDGAPVPPSLRWSLTHRRHDHPTLWPPDSPLWWQRLGFGFAVRKYAAAAQPLTMRNVAVAAPWWFLTAACVVISTVAYRSLWRGTRRRRRAAGQCESCGYDLRDANHERCPECGASVAPAVDVPARV